MAIKRVIIDVQNIPDYNVNPFPNVAPSLQPPYYYAISFFNIVNYGSGLYTITLTDSVVPNSNLLSDFVVNVKEKIKENLDFLLDSGYALFSINTDTDIYIVDGTKIILDMDVPTGFAFYEQDQESSFFIGTIAEIKKIKLFYYYLEPLNPIDCEKLKLNINFEDAVKLVGGTDTSYTSGKVIEIERDNKEHEYEFINQSLDRFVFKLKHPDKFSNLIKSVEINNGFIKINAKLDGVLLSYELNGVRQYNNVFTLPANTNVGGVLQIKIYDNFKCNEIVNVVYNGDLKEPFIYISKSNSVRYFNEIKQVNNNVENEDTTRLCDYPSKTVICKGEYFNTNDTVKIQVLTNYDTIIAKANDTSLPIQLIKQFINVNKKITGRAIKHIVEKRILFDYNNNNFADFVYLNRLYFKSGNVLDYVTEQVVGEYNLGSELPDFMQINNVYYIDNVPYLFTGSMFDDELQCFYIEFPSLNNFYNENLIVKSTYDINKYNVYEFTIDFISFIQKKFVNSNIIFNDPLMPTIEMKSDCITLEAKLDRFIKIVYWNDFNCDVYNSGIMHLINMQIDYIKSKTNVGKKEITIDNDVINYDVKTNEILEIKFEPVPAQLARKLILALSHQNLFLNNIKCKYKSHTEKQLEKSNLVEVIAILYKINNNKISITENQSNEIINLAGIINNNINLIKQ